jgi:hypothetical protein
LKVWKILKVMATETLARADRPSQQQREIEVLDVAKTCQPERDWEYDAAKLWFNRANPSKYLEGRKADFEAHFLLNGHTQGLKLRKRESAGGHRAPWYFEVYELADKHTVKPDDVGTTSSAQADTSATVSELGITYGVTKPGDIQLSWLGRLMLGNGAFKTKSGRGVLWASWMVTTGIFILSCGYVFFAMGLLNRPLHTSDLVLLIFLAAVGWAAWRMVLRPLLWLLDDRIILAAEGLMKFKEDPAQLDMTKDEAHRYIRLVRYSAVCSICAGNIELRYGYGQNHRRIFGCCSEVPTEHVFTFDRVTRMGQRYNA